MMIRTFGAAALAVAFALPALPAAAQETRAKEAAQPEKITDKNHPDYVRCRTEKVIGSLAKRRKTCLTNRQWAEFERRGNENARRTVEEVASGGPNS